MEEKRDKTGSAPPSVLRGQTRRDSMKYGMIANERCRPANASKEIPSIRECAEMPFGKSHSRVTLRQIAWIEKSVRILARGFELVEIRRDTPYRARAFSAEGGFQMGESGLPFVRYCDDEVSGHPARSS